MPASVAGIDVGTSKIKLDIYDGSRLVKRVIWNNEFIKLGNAVEQNPDLIRHRVTNAIDLSIRNGATCIGLSTYRGSILVWDTTGRKVTNTVTWMDRRSLEYYDLLPLKARIASKLPILSSTLSPESPIVKLKILINNKKDIYNGLQRGLYHAWNIDAFLIESLTKKYMSDPSNKALMGIIHPKDLKPIWLVARLLSLPRIPVPETFYHDAVIKTPDYSIGSVIGDQQATNHGIGCIEPGCIRVGMGSGLFVSITTGPDLVLTPGKGMVPLIIYMGKRSKIYGVESYITGLGKAVEWFVDNMLGGDYRLLDEVSAEPGKPPIILPFFWGLRYPRVRKGLAGVLGIEPGHTLRDIAKGVAHSLAASVAFQVKLVSRYSSGRTRVMLTGGLSRLKNLVSLIASYIDQVVKRSIDPDTAARGTAMLAARNCGVEGPSPSGLELVEPNTKVDILDPHMIFEYVSKLD